MPTILASGLCVQLTSLLRDSVSEVVREAVFALEEIARWPDGAQVVVDATVPNLLEELLEWPDADVRRITCRLVGNLAVHIESFVPSILLCMTLVSLLRDDQVINRATDALTKVSQRHHGARVLSRTKVLDYVPELLESSDADVRICSCSLVGNLARHEGIPPTVLEGKLCSHLVFLLRDGHVEVIKLATYALLHIAHWPDGAQILIRTDVLDYVAELLASSDADVRKWSCSLVGNLAEHQCIPLIVMDVELCAQLVSLLRDGHVEVTEQATYALMQIAHWPDGAQAVVDAKVPDFFQELLECPNTDVRRSLCWLVGNLAAHTESFLPNLLNSQLCMKLVSLLRGGRVEVIKEATYALMQIAHWSYGAQALVDAKIPYFFQELLESSNSEVRRSSCRLVGNLAGHIKPFVTKVYKSKLCVKLVSLLHSGRVEVIKEATYALTQIALWSDGAQAVVDAKVPYFFQELLESPNAEVRRISCRLVGNLAGHIKPFVPKVLESKLCMELVSLLHDEQVLNRATYALMKIARWPDGAQVLSRTNVLDYVPELLESLDADVRKCSCSLVGNLARHESIPPTVLDGKLCTHLVSLLRDGHAEVIEQATYALMHIAHWPDGAQAVFDAKLPYFFHELLESSNPEVRQISCRLVGNVAGHMKPFVPNVSKLCTELVSLLRDSVDEVVQWAAYALAEISRWPDGAQAVVDAKLPDILEELLECSNADVRRITCWLVGNLAAHIESFVPKVMKSKLCMEFVSLLHDGQVVNRATYALKKISRWPDGAQILSGTQVLDYVPELLESSDADVRKCSCSLVGNLARHESIPPNVLDGELCTRLASLLRDGHVEVIEQATYALGQISHWPDGAQAVIDAQVPDFLQELLESSNAHIRRTSCRLAGNLAAHIESFVPNLSNSQQLCAKLVSLLRDSQVEVIKEATYALRCIAYSPNGAQAVMDDIEGFDYLRELLKCSDADVRKWACSLVGVLAGHDVFLPAILASKLYGQLVSLLRDEDIWVIEQATYALWSIACWPAGAPAVVEAKVVDYIRGLLESYNANVREGACRLIASIATHEDSARATFDLQLCSWLLLLAWFPYY
ncbi:armadillo-type protein [Mycena galericulata]|nr:armadillo-type protein [Mycena galericulata]